MKLDQIYVPKIKIANFLSKNRAEQDKKDILRDVLPKLCSPGKSETQRVCILNWPRPGYISKRVKGDFQHFRSKSFKTPTNMCQQNLLDFQNKKNIKNLAIEIRKIDQKKRQILDNASPLAQKLGDNVLKISTDSLVYRQNAYQRREKTVRNSNAGDSRQTRITQKLKSLKYHYNAQKNQKDYNYLRKKYAELTFHQIIESQSDGEENPNRGRAERRKVKTEMSHPDKQ